MRSTSARPRLTTRSVTDVVEGHSQFILLIALVTAAIIRVLAQVALGFYDGPETFEEGEIAREMSRGAEYSYQQNGATAYAFRAPAYAYLLAGTYGLFGSEPITAGVLQACLGVALTACVWSLGRTLGLTTMRSAAAAFLVAAHPGLVVYATKIHQLNLDAVLLTLGVVLLIRSQPGRSRIEAFALGLVAGISALSRPTFLLGMAVGGLVRWRSRAARFAVVAVIAGATVVLAPWLIRSTVLIGVPVLTSSSGHILWIGNNPSATGSTVTVDGRPMLDTAPDLLASTWGRDELTQDRIFRDRALQFMREEPLTALRLFVQKFVAFWWFGPTVGSTYPSEWKLLYVGYYSALAVGTIVGTIALLRRRDTRDSVTAIVLVLVVVAAAQALFYVDGRHRWAVEPVMLVLASGVGLAGRAGRPQDPQRGPAPM